MGQRGVHGWHVDMEQARVTGTDIWLANTVLGPPSLAASTKRQQVSIDCYTNPTLESHSTGWIQIASRFAQHF